MKERNAKQFVWEKASEEERIQRLKQSFEKYVVRKKGCWKWTGSKDKDGYGEICYGRVKSLKAHRVSWELHKGEHPGKFCVCHKCDNPECCNPDHLFLGTKKDNSIDAKNKGRTTIGEKNINCKLTKEKVIEIRKLLKKGVSQLVISKQFNVSQKSISRIKTNETWGHIEEEKINTFDNIKSFRLGSNNHTAKLNESQVSRIKKRLRDGVSCVRLASDYNVGYNVIWCIKEEETWKHVS